ncbi:MAG: hypothetical protein V4635_13620 [Bacteroidota bacterium]
MKTSILLSLIVVASLSSCRKKYNCVCTTSGTVVSTTEIRATKSNATADCNAMSSNGNNGKTCSIQ